MKTPGGTVRARRVGVGTGGYTSNGPHKELKNRLLTILSRPLQTALYLGRYVARYNRDNQQYQVDLKS